LKIWLTKIVTGGKRGTSFFLRDRDRDRDRHRHRDRDRDR
jgi:hypothetical protein